MMLSPVPSIDALESRIVDLDEKKYEEIYIELKDVMVEEIYAKESVLRIIRQSMNFSKELKHIKNKKIKLMLCD